VDGKEFLFDQVNDPYQLANLAEDRVYARQMRYFRAQLKDKMASLKDTFEASTWYRDHWTDGERRIMRTATRDFTA
jgi:hypothetical protein